MGNCNQAVGGIRKHVRVGKAHTAIDARLMGCFPDLISARVL